MDASAVAGATWGADPVALRQLAGDSWANPYSASVRIALADAGVPPGSTIILTGHSFGA